MVKIGRPIKREVRMVFTHYALMTALEQDFSFCEREYYDVQLEDTGPYTLVIGRGGKRLEPRPYGNGLGVDVVSLWLTGFRVYEEADIARVYSASAVESCMSKGEKYRYMQALHGIARVLVLESDGEIIGRALVWEAEMLDGEKWVPITLLDRAYGNPAVRLALYRYARDRGWKLNFRLVDRYLRARAYDLEKRQGNLPYLDTLYYCVKGESGQYWLTNMYPSLVRHLCLGGTQGYAEVRDGREHIMRGW